MKETRYILNNSTKRAVHKFRFSQTSQAKGPRKSPILGLSRISSLDIQRLMVHISIQFYL